jgi:hypothetical protein
MAVTADLSRPLTEAEMATLAKLLPRAFATSRAAVPKTGSQYQALVNLSVPRTDDADRQTDLVTRGNTVILTDEQAAKFLPPVKPFPMIRRIKDQHEPLPRITGRHMSGPIRQPPVPQPGTADPRPDPAGSSVITEVKDDADQNPPVPEMNEPAAGSENAPVTTQDAIDLPPGTRVTNGITRQ